MRATERRASFWSTTYASRKSRQRSPVSYRWQCCCRSLQPVKPGEIDRTRLIALGEVRTSVSDDAQVSDFKQVPDFEQALEQARQARTQAEEAMRRAAELEAQAEDARQRAEQAR